MLFNQKWEAQKKHDTIKLYAGGLNFVPADKVQDYAPVKPDPYHFLHYPTAMKPFIETDWRKCLADAADLIEERGWVQGRDEGPLGICAGHAITMTARNAMIAGHAMGILSAHVGGQSIPAWNDNRCRSKYEVIGTLRCVAEFG